MFRSSVFLLGSLVVITACGGSEEPEVIPAPVTVSGPGVNQDSIDAAARADSIARAEAARRDSLAGLEAARAGLVNELAAMIHFDYDQFSVRSADQQLLSRKADILRANPGLRIRIVGHADERGSDEYNLSLGMRRAVGAKEYLVRLGIDGGRIETASLGEEVPLNAGATEAAWAANRRGEFEITAGGQALVAPGM